MNPPHVPHLWLLGVCQGQSWLEKVSSKKTNNLILNPFNCQEWPRQNFSLQYQYNIRQTSDENEEKYQLADYKLIQYQFLHTNITRTVWQTVRRITNEILGVMTWIREAVLLCSSFKNKLVPLTNSVSPNRILDSKNPKLETHN